MGWMPQNHYTEPPMLAASICRILYGRAGWHMVPHVMTCYGAGLPGAAVPLIVEIEGVVIKCSASRTSQ